MKKRFSRQLVFNHFKPVAAVPIAAFFTALTLLAFAATCFAAKPVADVKVQLVMVPMRDGVHLATDVDMPDKATGTLPTILVRSPYGRSLGAITKIIRGFIGSRYVLVSQDTRGRGGSEGKNLPFLTDSEDGYDTVEWVAAQPWSDGRVAILGGSALAITGYQAAIAAPPHLKCIVALVAPADIQTEAILWGGQLRKDLAIGWTVGTDYPVETLNPMTDHPVVDDFAKKYDLAYNAPHVQTPMFHVGGWFDIFTQGTIAAYNSLQENGGPGARGKQRLIMGPWTHVGEIATHQGDLEFPNNSGIMPMVKTITGWMNKCMNDTLQPEPLPVQYYIVGDVDTKDARWNVWKKSTDWPPAAVKSQTWRLTPSQTLDPDGETKETRKFSYKFDPANPVKTIGGGNLTIGTSGPMDQREEETRPDVILFNSPEFKEPYGIAGPVYAELTVSTTGCDTDFTAKLTDVYPDGRSILVVDGIARARFRNANSDSVVQAEKDEKMKIRVYVGDIAYVFNKGHKMRLAISSSNHPRFSVNTNTCEDLAFPHNLLEAEYRAAKKKDESPVHAGINYITVDNTLYTGGNDSSAIILPGLDLDNK